jgi:hypothetical protein
LNPISKKLRELENNVIDTKPKTPSYFHITDSSELELHKRAYAILSGQHDKAQELHNNLIKDPKAKVDVGALDLSPDDKAIVDASTKIFRSRVLEVFDVAIAQYCHLNDPVNKWIFYSRFNWFIREMRDWLFLRWREDQIYDAPDFFDLCAGEQERRLAPVYSKWRKYLTEESWSKFYEEHCRRPASEIPELTAEEIAEDEKLTAQENAEEEAKDAKFLAEKCPGCKEKCKWYHEQIEDEKNLFKCSKERN